MAKRMPPDPSLMLVSMVLSPSLLLVSPMRRATRTGLLAFSSHVSSGLKVLALELLHETGGRHTCDRRLRLSELRQSFPSVDYSLISSEDDPLVVQFAGHEPSSLLAAARLVQDRCDAVDINLGCPQRIAKRGRFGAYLLEEYQPCQPAAAGERAGGSGSDWPLLRDLVGTLHCHLDVPVTCSPSPSPSPNPCP